MTVSLIRVRRMIRVKKVEIVQGPVEKKKIAKRVTKRLASLT